MAMKQRDHDDGDEGKYTGFRLDTIVLSKRSAEWTEALAISHIYAVPSGIW